jgi:hypothetical protein
MSVPVHLLRLCERIHSPCAKSATPELDAVCVDVRRELLIAARSDHYPIWIRGHARART